MSYMSYILIESPKQENKSPYTHQQRGKKNTKAPLL